MTAEDTIEWIKRKFFATCSKEDFEQLGYFCLLWGSFEKIVGNCELNLGKIDKFIVNNTIPVDKTILEPCFIFFNDRYVTNNGTNEYFDKLFRKPKKKKSEEKKSKEKKDYKEELKNILLNNNPTEQDKILGVSIIAYRIRNNSFHGTKELPEIKDQQETFKYLNKFLMMFLEGFSLI